MDGNSTYLNNRVTFRMSVPEMKDLFQIAMEDLLQFGDHQIENLFQLGNPQIEMEDLF